MQQPAETAFLPSLRRPDSSLIPQPGLARRQAAMERYRVPAGGAIVVALKPGDRLTVASPYGGQAGELTAFAADGRNALAALGAADEGAAVHLLDILAGEGAARDGFRWKMTRQGFALAEARAMRLFAAEGEPGETRSFLAVEALSVAVAAPGRPMLPERQDAPSDLAATIERAQPLPDNEMPLPDPLAEPRLDFRVKAGTAVPYEVKAGEYVQVIDVAGRECSDFICMGLAALSKGIVEIPDPTATHSNMGAAYPAPGLFNKFYTHDQQTLMEIVQDTCGRHDYVGTACTAKYYDDQGFPGHPSCSENFNAVFAPYGVPARRAWPAVNFYYNTGFDAQNQYFLDEPWSRPGDYVLLKSHTDLLCGSTACPDDTSPTNGWNPTDIHVRVYPANNRFKRAVAYRMTPDAEMQLTKETGFHPRTSALTRHFTEYRGYWLPNQFHNGGAEQEYWACREGVIAMDLSALRKFEVFGPDAEMLMQTALTRNVRKLSVGQVVYSAMCYEHGGMIDDGTLFKLGPHNFRWIGGDDYGGVWLRELAQKLGLRVQVRPSTDQLHNISVQGPKSLDVLKAVVWTAESQPTVEEIGWFRFTVGRVGDHNGIPLVVSRTGYTGELGYEVWCHPKDAPGLWDAVMEAGKPQDIKPLGLAGLDLLRIESGLIFAGYEFDDQTDPFEAGVGFTVALKSKEDDFVGRAALERRKANPQRKLVGLELAGNEAAAHGDCVHIGRAQVGVVTSGMISPKLAKSIALCRMDVSAAEEGTEVEVGKIDGHQKRVPARVVPFPFYDPEKKRPRGLA